MKKINIALVVIVAFLSVSCDKFLDIEPVGRIIPKSYTDFRGVITSGYVTVSSDRSLIALRGDESFIDQSSFLFESGLDVYVWNDFQQSTNTKQYSWQQSYKAILHANNVIADGPNATGATSEMVKQLVGEAYLLRAYVHFNLISLYADQYGITDPKTTPSIPLSIAIDIETIYKRNTVAEVYNQILSDIDKGLKMVNVDMQPVGFNYRFSKISAYGFAARVYLSMGDYAKAAEYADKALSINSKLENFNVKGFTLPYNYKSTENVLALERTIGSSITKDILVSDGFLKKYYSNKDLRLVNFYSSSYDGTKVNAEDKTDYRVSMRTAEFYLIKAEALARGADKLVEAKDALKVLLKNRLTPDYYTQRVVEIDAMGKDEFVQFVLDERARELAFQGFRWFDLKRNGKPSITKEVNGKTYTLQQNDSRYVVSFPKDAVANNPYLAN